jgi:hypothetical protein
VRASCALVMALVAQPLYDPAAHLPNIGGQSGLALEGRFMFPLCDLEVTAQSDPRVQPVELCGVVC